MKGAQMKKMGVLGWITFVLVVIGGLNWGLVGFFDYNVVEEIFGIGTTVTSIIYDLVGLSAIYMIVAGLMGSKAE